MALTIKPYLRVYTGADMHYRFNEEAEERYEDRDDMRYFDRYDYSDEDSDSDSDESDSIYGDSASTAFTSWQATVNTGNAVNNQAESKTDVRIEDGKVGDNAQSKAETAEVQTHDLSYYGYGDYDFGQLSRVTTMAVNIHDLMDPNPVTVTVEERDDDGDDEDEEEEEGEDEEAVEEADEADDLGMENRRWHCPEPRR
ncbi:hypothetical protein Sste5344_000246 [Sporothrix stenoceras]